MSQFKHCKYSYFENDTFSPLSELYLLTVPKQSADPKKRRETKKNPKDKQ